MSALSQVGICNLALGWLGANRITSFDDEAVEAQLCKDNFDALWEALLEAAEWTFSQYRFIPAASSTPPAWGFSSQFLIPPDVLRVHYVGNSPRQEEDDPVPAWTKESPAGIGDVIACDASTIYCRGTRRLTDISKVSELFAQALAARLAADLAMPLTNSPSMAGNMWQLFGNKLAEAISKDSQQGRMRAIRASGMLQSRRSGGGIIGPTV